MRKEHDEQEEERRASRQARINGLIAFTVVITILTVLGTCFGLYWGSLLKGSFDFDSVTTRLKEFYPEEAVEWQDGDETISFNIRNDGDFMRYCFAQFPDAYRKNKSIQTADDVIELFKTDYDAWGYLKDVRYDVYVSWLNDGRHGWHCYIIDPDYPNAWDSPEYKLGVGWLYKDGVRLTVCDDVSRISDSMEPHDLIVRYQTGEWSGNVLRSTDYSTLVYIDSSGRLFYEYSVEYYDEANDPQGIAYRGYDVPWWEKTSVDDSLSVLQQPDEVVDGMETRSIAKWVEYYPDMPIDYSPTVYAVERYNAHDRTDIDQEVWKGMFVLTESGVTMFSRGETVDRWEFDVMPPGDDASYCFFDQTSIYDEESGYFAVVYVNDQLIGLKKGGQAEVIFDKVVSTSVDRFSYGVMGLEGDKLMYWNCREITLIAEGVIDAEFGKRSIYEKEDGCYAINPLDKYDGITRGYETTYLGDFSLQYCLWLYDRIEDSCFYH